MDKRYQVFVSSTFVDLQEERQRVIQTLMEMDCIPAGMELFPAIDDEQWSFIKSVIDDCDYYVVIIGGRYGSLSTEGVSYTEKEFDYAVARGLKVVALLHEDPDSLAVGKSEIDPAAREKLEAFKDKVSTGRLVRRWKSKEDIAGVLALSLQKTIKAYPAVGWVRADKVASDDLLRDSNQLRVERDALRKELDELQAAKPIEIPDIAPLSDTFSLVLYWTGGDYSDRNYNAHISWEDLFAVLAPGLEDSPSDGAIAPILAGAIYRKCTHQAKAPHRISMNRDDLSTVRIQLQSLGLIDIAQVETAKGMRHLVWSLTGKGRELMVKLRVVRKANA